MALDFTAGQRIRIHPASDWFMRGVVYARIVTVGRKWLTVECERTGTRFKLAPCNVLEVL